MNAPKRDLVKQLGDCLSQIHDSALNVLVSTAASALDAALDERQLLEKLHTEQVCLKHNLAAEIARLQAENEQLVRALNQMRCSMERACDGDEHSPICSLYIARRVLKENHGKQ